MFRSFGCSEIFGGDTAIEICIRNQFTHIRHCLPLPVMLTLKKLELIVPVLLLITH